MTARRVCKERLLRLFILEGFSCFSSSNFPSSLILFILLLTHLFSGSLVQREGRGSRAHSDFFFEEERRRRRGESSRRVVRRAIRLPSSFLIFPFVAKGLTRQKKHS